MATIVQMPTPRSRTDRAADDPNGATILFFTGIRYVRDEEPADEEPADAHEGHQLTTGDPDRVLSMI